MHMLPQCMFAIGPNTNKHMHALNHVHYACKYKHVFACACEQIFIRDASNAVSETECESFIQEPRVQMCILQSE